MYKGHGGTDSLLLLNPLVLGDGMPLPCEQDLLSPAISLVTRDAARSAAPLAAGQARPLRYSDLPSHLGPPGHHRHVLHPRLQRQSELASHSIAIIPELLRGGTVQNTDLKRRGGKLLCPNLYRFYQQVKRVTFNVFKSVRTIK